MWTRRLKSAARLLMGTRLCAACYMFHRDYPTPDLCAGYRRSTALRKRYCRSCWNQAREHGRTSGQTGGRATAIHFLDGVGAHHQLFLANLHSQRGSATSRPGQGYGRRGRPRKQPPPAASRPTSRWVQPLLVTGVRRDFSRFDERAHADPANPWLAWAIHVAHRFGEGRGWPRTVHDAARRGLVIVLSGHVDGDQIFHSDLLASLNPVNVPIRRVAEVLAEMGVLIDDRPRAFDGWPQRKLAGLATGIAGEVETWLKALHDGGHRTKPRAPVTAYNHMNRIRPLLLDWSDHYAHLREVTRDDVLAAVEHRHGSDRGNTLVSLRSLFSFCKKNSMIFRNPTRGIKVGEHAYGVIQQLRPADIEQAVASATTPAARLILVLAAVHAGRNKQIAQLLLDDVDLGNRRLIIAGRVRPIDEFTLQALLDWLDHRRARCPNTANPHLLISQHTAVETGPVSTFWAKKALRGQTATLEQLRVDRQLEEALTAGADPLHLASVFGLDPKTAIRYAEAARQHLETAAEQHVQQS